MSALCSELCEDRGVSDPGLVFDRIRSFRRAGLVTHGPLPATLADALPNREFWFKEGRRTIEFRFSTAVVVGQVVGVTKGPAFAHEGDDRLRRVDFDDPSAAERAIDVRVRVEELFGPHGRSEIPTSGELLVRWGGLGGLDGPRRRAYIAAMASMGRAVAVLEARRDRDDEVFIPVLRGALFGQVNGLGELMFPGMGDDEQSFVGSIQNVEELRRAAAAHTTTSRWDGPRIN